MTVDVFIEIPKGSRNKYEFDPRRKVVRYDRMLFSAMHYPCDYGFITETLAEDGDPLDAMVLIWEPTFPGCLIEANPVGLFRMFDEKGQDDKILCVPVNDPMWNTIKSLKSVPGHLLVEIEHFFKVYKELEKKKTGIQGWVGLKEARMIIKEARDRFRKAPRK